MKTNNYNEFDTFKIYVKESKRDEVVKNYEAFGYFITKEEPNKHYDDILNLEFERPHKIENKDELQLLQIYMEENVNKIAKLEKQKHSKSTTLGLSTGLLCLAFIVLGAYLVLKTQTAINMIFGIISIVVGITIGILTIIFTTEITKKENKQFDENINLINQDTQKIISQAKKLAGGLYERQ